MLGKKFIAALIIGGNLLFTSTLNAAVQTYNGVGEYIMGERDTLETAKQSAKDRALRNALEKAGVLVQSHSRTEDLELVEDVITAQTGAVLKVIETLYEREDLLIRARVVVDIDADDLNRRLESFNNMPVADKISLANKKVDEAMKFWYDNKNDEAIALLTEAAALNPNDAQIYFKRAMIFVGLGEFTNAGYDAEKVLRLDPNHTDALWIRGANNLLAGKHSEAIDDLNASIRLNPKNKYAYYFRGLYYKNFGENDKAREDFLRAKKLGFYGSAAKKFLEGDK